MTDAGDELYEALIRCESWHGATPHLQTRVVNALLKAGITLEQFKKMMRNEFLRMGALGPTSCRFIERIQQDLRKPRWPQRFINTWI